MASLEMFWFIGLSAATAACGRRARACEDEAAQIAWIRAAIFAYATAWWLSWKSLGSALLDQLDAIVIEPGTDAHTATVVATLLLIAAAWCWLLVFAGGASLGPRNRA